MLRQGVPSTHLGGVLLTAQPSLAEHEGNAEGVWTWNTWLPAYLAAGSMALLGCTPFAARLPFALAGALALWLWWLAFKAAERDELVERRPWAAESALALLALSAPYLLFSRQSRYYALAALGTAWAVLAWRRLLAGRPWGVAGLALSLNFLLHSAYAFFFTTALALALDAALRLDECVRARRFWKAGLLTVVLALPVIVYFRVWDRPGNHGYGPGEGLEFAKTFLLWLLRFALPAGLAAAVLLKRAALQRPAAPLAALGAGAALLLTVCGEGGWSEAAAGLGLLGGLALAAAAPAPYGVLSLPRLGLLLGVSSVALLSFFAAEPYGRYLAPVLPLCAYACGRWISELSGRRAWAVAALTAFVALDGALYAWPVRAAAALESPAPAESVSGMMRLRLREAPRRSEPLRFVAGLGREGYVDPLAAAMRAGGGKTFFSDADALSFRFATRMVPVYDARHEPDWLVPSPWLKLIPEQEAAVRELLASGRYEPVPVEGPRELWENNPDPLYREPNPPRGPLPLFRRKAMGSSASNLLRSK